MIIQHNMLAQNTTRRYFSNSTKLRKASERLSSGYQINRAADNAAGLQISEKMQSQIRGLNQASENIQDGISLIQTADGAMNEMHDMINRLTELSVQAANDTCTNDDRLNIQEEVNQLLNEIDSLTDKTEFNGIKVLLGTETKTPIFGINGGLPNLLIGIPDGGTANSTALGSLSTTYSITNSSNVAETHSAFYLDFTAINASNASSLLGQGFYTTCCTCNNRYSIQFVDSWNSVVSDYTNFIYNVDITGVSSGEDVINRILTVLQSNGKTASYTDTLSNKTINAVEPQSHFTSFTAEIDAAGNYTGRMVIFDNRPNITPTPSVNLGIFEGGIYASQGISVTGKEMIHIQAGANSNQSIDFKLPLLLTSTMGLTGLSVLSHNSAANAISKIEDARAYLSSERSRIGAVQSRLEFAQRNTDNIEEQTQNAENIVMLLH